ncbi:hypothetical protein DID88_009812 [Monilinia fructigena]|uniref:Uncharacterized protein n=1 Tax=Monilinia fructigena TaxID=38457 RepID=A0A395IKL1_9HELO|nr:hypothetical protein DID88_009812 [Monilinia fructigena]
MGTAKESPKILKAKESVTKTSPILDLGGSPNSAKKNAAKATKVDKRILARCAPFAGPRRDSPFLIRESLVKAIPGINEGDIPEVVGCKTGWALHPKSLEVRDILMKEAHKLKICEITGATRLDLPETWYNHRVRQVPRSLFSAIDGQVKVTEEMVAREARIQTSIAPVRCLESSEAWKRSAETTERSKKRVLPAQLRVLCKQCAPSKREPKALEALKSSTNSTVPSSTTRTPALTRVEIQVPATLREGGESAKRTTDSPVSQTRASKRSRAAPGQMNLKLLSRNSVRKARVEDAMDTDDDDVAATTQLIEATDPFSNE